MTDRTRETGQDVDQDSQQEAPQGAATRSDAPASTERESPLWKALGTVIDPELRRTIVDLDMVESASIDSAGTAHVKVLLTISGCPMKGTISKDVRDAAATVEGVESVDVELGVMTPEQRGALRDRLRSGEGRVNPFTQPGNLTRVIAVASGKGGVGKSSVTANLAAQLSASGLQVGILDADIYGFSIPPMMGVTGKPTKLEDMILPQPGHGVAVMSIGMFVNPGQAVVWRGPMLHRALEQFLTDVFWGDLDVLLLDLPPGTGDVAISVGQLLPESELLIVTTPQQAAAQVAERAGALATSTGQKITGVIENMSWMVMPDGSHNPIFGEGGGRQVADALATRLADAGGQTHVPLLGQIPLDPTVREGADMGLPAVLSSPDEPGPAALRDIASRLRVRSQSLAGRSLGLSPVH